MEIGVVERNPESYNRSNVALGKVRSPAELDKEVAERLEEIHQYLRDRYASREVATRAETPAGQQLDWLPIESQSPDGKIADPPDEDRPALPHGGEYEAEPVRFELQDEDAETGPPGTVPVVRTPIERIRPVGDLQDWLAKGIKAKRLTPPDDPGGFEPRGDPTEIHKYAHAYQPVTCYGTEGNINLWRPYVEWSDEFSLGQLWLARGSGIQKQTLEIGAQTYRDLYGDWEPHLFIFYTTNGYTQSSNNLGGYNTDVDGWVQVSRSIFPSARLSTLSQFRGSQINLPIRVELFQGNWWIRVNGEYIGYYPATLYGSTGLRSQSDVTDWGGAIVDSPRHPGTTQTGMGSGHWPYEGYQWCAYMNNLQYQSTSGGQMIQMQGIGQLTHPNCYGLEAHFGTADSTWGSYFWWGGSGRNPACP